ncbi:hypothetical protein Z664_02055 [Coxiella endosymbiont of Amblyomma americanum]|nr:hypothetical protein Z664_02055 [Coxiella endosymbiont of Amblyomma americanum]
MESCVIKQLKRIVYRLQITICNQQIYEPRLPARHAFPIAVPTSKPNAPPEFIIGNYKAVSVKKKDFERLK